MNRLFEYDDLKSKSNSEKHGIDFETAKIVWEDKFAIVAPTKQVDGENRFIIVGMIARRLWSIIFTVRREKIRVISARRSRKEEVYHYEKNKL